MRAKKSAFWLLLQEINPDILIGSETWLHSGFHEREVLPPGYHFVARRDRPSNHYGGVMIAAKDCITGTELKLDSRAEICAASFSSPSKQPLIIASIYRPPSSDPEYMKELCDTIRHLHQSTPKATVWIAGDANLPDIDWTHNSISGHYYNNQISKHLLDTIADTGSEQLVSFPTRGNNILDIFITNRPSLIDRIKAVPGVSDHDIIFVQAATSTPRKKPPRRKILLWKQVDEESIRNTITNYSNKFITDHNTDNHIDELWNTFRDFCINTIDTYIPSKNSSQRYSQPWITRRVKRLSRRKKRAYRKAKRTGKTEDTQLYKSLQKQTQTECRNAYNAYVRDTVQEDNNPKKLYSFIKSKRCDSFGVPPLRENGLLQSDPKIKASLLNKQFSSVFTKEDPTDLPSMDGNPYPAMDSFGIGREGVHKLLRGLKIHKATGPDAIPTRFLHDYASELTPMITLIFQASLHQASVPSDWNTALVTPIFKKGDKSSPTNYRPISLTSVCCKLLEHIMHSQIMKHLDHHHVLTDAQHGFRKRRSCETQLLLTLQDLAQALDAGEQIDAVLLDFSKAFDKVPHQHLAVKLKHYGISGRVLQWIQSFLSNRSQSVIVEGQRSDPAPVTSGVPQGSVLGPLLFLVYINDMPSKASSPSRLFADDSLLYRKIKSANDTLILQNDLDALQDWEKTWKMEFNPSKCEVIRITRKRAPLEATYQIHGQDLNMTKSGKYLGVTIANDLSWRPHVDTVTKSASNSLAFLRRNLSSCPKDIKLQAYKSLVRPILDYASSAWDPHTQVCIQQLESVQRRAARFITGDYRHTSSTSQMISNLGLPSLEQRRQDSKLLMMHRVTFGLVDIPVELYLRQSQASTRGHGIPSIDGSVIRYWIPYCRTDTLRHSFFISGARLWNQLPTQLATPQTQEAFREGLAAIRL